MKKETAKSSTGYAYMLAKTKPISALIHLAQKQSGRRHAGYFHQLATPTAKAANVFWHICPTCIPIEHNIPKPFPGSSNSRIVPLSTASWIIEGHPNFSMQFSREQDMPITALGLTAAPVASILSRSQHLTIKSSDNTALDPAFGNLEENKCREAKGKNSD
ncbi:hypothetical protein Nepgr_024009 [Nepenthes gracilis]|uniref:Uncharacterized protein n=1 Tax=Nepenthes gracilis TaxID=150966 RepID=A0AAD3T3X8_NEPGR|nr:hypothetical protein Nepgr_024009 [Nepenthes gracilis]